MGAFRQPGKLKNPIAFQWVHIDSIDRVFILPAAREAPSLPRPTQYVRAHTDVEARICRRRCYSSLAGASLPVRLVPASEAGTAASGRLASPSARVSPSNAAFKFAAAMAAVELSARTALREVRTPCAVVRLPVVRANCERMLANAASKGVRAHSRSP